MAEAVAAAKRGEGGPLPGVSLLRRRRVQTAAPEGGDLYLIRHLCTITTIADCVRILANVRRAMQPDARVLVLEAPLPSETAGPGRWLDLQVMLLRRPRRTVQEYAGLFDKAGLRLSRTIPTRHPAMTVVEAGRTALAPDGSMARAAEAASIRRRHVIYVRATTRRAPGLPRLFDAVLETLPHDLAAQDQAPTRFAARSELGLERPYRQETFP